MRTWDELRVILAGLASQNPGPLTSWPDPDRDDAQPPFELELEPWATDTARDLHARFGRDVRLMVGALRYPERALAAEPVVAGPPPPELDPAQISVALDGPLTVRSGGLAHHGLVVRNLGASDVLIGTTGELIAEVVDPVSAAVVGGYAGAVRLMLTTFTVAPGAARRVPLLVGTASLVPSLGYAIPPGEWGLRATLDPAAGRAVRTPSLPVTITT
jgi:hypothetical protein